ncbi:metalloregulator ArsR/SmtB family transcription factor [Acidianus sp. HS-5]|uniref:ArsR/SmtB family transcription factor n=1 Tax=Acidianus sp. HS-5 TaxID=2886040 RepID=UPI001F02C797|nr:metalloregulator ArsR/SmtB family transcription factor [Acidianus sp. HS-5]BDC17678.1 transcriptional regulator [Acidianus sp. HS-5]
MSQFSNENLLLELEIFFSTLSDKTRLEIILYLLEKEKATVQEISTDLNKSQSLISHHLAYLRNCGIVRVERNGKYSVYSVSDKDVKEILQIAIKHTRNYSESILSCDVMKEEKKSS